MEKIDEWMMQKFVQISKSLKHLWRYNSIFILMFALSINAREDENAFDAFCQTC